jgi:DNA-binding response OmpR family regulator
VSVAGNAAARVLVIDDDPQVRLLISMILEDEGLAVEAAMGGAEALRLATEQPPALVVLDMSLPDMTGETLAEHLRSLWPGLPILVVTADGRARDKVARIGAFGYLLKPFDLAELVALVQHGLSR